ncbi:MAG: DNA repair protein RadC [Candidimonas sp.]|jgi:DNA repair protein RadC
MHLHLTGPHPERPRERLLRHGAAALTTAELLAIILRTGVKGCGAVELGHRLLAEFGGLRSLLCTDSKRLMHARGLGSAKTCQLLAVKELNRRMLEEELKIGRPLNQPHRVKQFCLSQIGHLPVEHCIALYLDSQFHLIAWEEVSRGTLTQTPIYPREIIKSCLKHHAAAIILAHNHPSGVQEPSQADRSLTRHLEKALALVDVRLLDHLIVTATHAVSLAERGELG